MSMREGEESREDVMQYARLSGHKITLAQLHRYQQERVIQGPRKIHLGYGRGTRTVYPPGTSLQLRAACEATAKLSSFRRARWQLWWDGYVIEISRIRTLLSESIKRFSKQGRIPRESRRRLRDPEVTRLREIVTEMQNGKFHGFGAPTDPKLISKALGFHPALLDRMNADGFWPDVGTENLAKRFSEAVNMREIEKAFHAASDNELEAARNEVRALLSHTNQLALIVEKMGPSSLGNWFAKVGESTISEQQEGLLFWLCCRRYPVGRQAYDLINLVLAGAMPAIRKD
jgi:hypothetical protein